MKNKINGNITGIRNTVLSEMELMYDMRCERGLFIGNDLLEAMARYTTLLNREISVYIARDGSVRDISVGGSGTVSMPTMRLSRGEVKLSGIRCVHTHPGGNGLLSSVDMGTLLSAKLDAMAAVGVSGGELTTFYSGVITDEPEPSVRILGPFDAKNLPHEPLLEAMAESISNVSLMEAADIEEKAVLIGIDGNTADYDSLDELALLADTAGAAVLHISRQKRNTPDKAYYIGSGKAQELGLIVRAKNATLCIFDDELTGIQLRNLEDILGVKVIDRATLILDIFSRHAKTREGKLQVELAQLKYRLPRLLGMGNILSRQGAGIGTRGPGEKKLEIDRRRIRSRIHDLENELLEIAKQRNVRRLKRAGNDIPLVAIAGYTNAGKSTLLNLLSGSGVLTEDKLFATLDPVTRRVRLESGLEFLLADTVGFINKLPHDLIEAFKSTLEEITYADLILHVVDISNEYHDVQTRVVESVLNELGAADTPCITVYNKMDGLEPFEYPPHGENTVCISALKNKGVDALIRAISKTLEESRKKYTILIPFNKGGLIDMIQSRGRILSIEHAEEGTRVCALMDNATHSQLMSGLSK